MKNETILKEKIKKIIKEHAYVLCYNECGNSLQKNEYEIDEEEVNIVVDLIIEEV